MCKQNTCKIEIENNMILEIILNSCREFNIIITDKEKKIFDLPKEHPYPYDSQTQKGELNEQLMEYYIKIHTNPVQITINRKEEIIFQTIVNSIFIKKNHVGFTTQIPSKELFGFSEMFNQLKIEPNQIYTQWNFDRPSHQNEDKLNTYGFHPMYLVQEKSLKWHTVLLRTSMGLDIDFRQNLNEYVLKFTKIGGIIDLKFFMSDATGSPESSIKLYHQYLGGFNVPNFWTLGFHQSRYGYKSDRELEQVLNNYVSYNIPLDTFWLDIDYLKDHKPFQINEKFDHININRMRQEFNKKMVLIVEPTIAYQPGTVMFDQGSDIYLKNEQGNHFIGSQWPGQVVYPDFTHPDISEFWLKSLTKLRGCLNYDGIWLDMNEIAQFSNGNYQNKDIQGQSFCAQEQKQFPYNLKNQPCLSRNSLDIKLKHYQGFTELEMHNFYAYMQSYQTFNVLQKILNTKNPFILSRSTSFGIQKYTAHWSGDNYSSWQQLRSSLSQIFRSQLYGIALSGVDICGFLGDATNELCARWMQVGSLYPFSRNHNAIYQVNQDPFSFKSYVFESSQKNLRLRYSILRHYLTQFILANHTGTIFRPLFLEFYLDQNVLSNDIINTQFMIGTSLMCSPVLQPNSIFVQTYFPQARWYSFHNGDMIIDEYKDSRILNIMNKYDDLVPLYQRDGTIVVRQNQKVQSSDQLDHNIQLQIALKISPLNDTLLSNATGQIAVINSLNNNSIVLDNCVINSCISNLNIDVINVESFVYQIHIQSSSVETNQNYSNVKSLIFMGMTQTIDQIQQYVLLHDQGFIQFSDQQVIIELIDNHPLIYGYPWSVYIVHKDYKQQYLPNYKQQNSPQDKLLLYKSRYLNSSSDFEFIQDDLTIVNNSNCNNVEQSTNYLHIITFLMLGIILIYCWHNKISQNNRLKKSDGINFMKITEMSQQNIQVEL